ncbi:MAG: hypothetical protein V3U84_07380 [Thiotrichaceae bacterium]
MKNLLSLLFVTIFVTGCSSIPQQSFNAEANKNIKTVALIKPPAVKEVNVGIVHHPGNSFGLIGAAIAAADTAGKTSDYNKALGTNKVNWSAYAQAQLKAQLEKNGYTVKNVVARKKGNSSAKFMETYPDTGTDAILDYYYNVQYLATGPTTDYIPTVNFMSRLVKSSDKSVIYAQHFVSGNAVIAAKGAVATVNNTGFNNIASLKAKPKESVQALKKGVDTIASLIGKDLKNR